MSSIGSCLVENASGSAGLAATTGFSVVMGAFFNLFTGTKAFLYTA